MSETPDFVAPSNQRDGPDGAIPRFYVRPVQNGFKSNEQGHPVFDDVEFVEIIIPGDRKTTWDGMVKEEHRQRWPQKYRSFKDALEAPSEGTPLSEWAAITRSQAEELAFQRVRTIEALAGLSDHQVTTTIAMGGMALREKARRFLEQAAGSAPAEKLAAENAIKDAKIEELQGQVTAFQQRLEALERGPAKDPPPAPKKG